MRVLAYIGLGLWVCFGLVIFMWNLILSAQMLNNRVPKDWPILGRRQFAFQTDPADYTEIGQRYRAKSIRAEIILLAYVPTLFVAICFASWLYIDIAPDLKISGGPVIEDGKGFHLDAIAATKDDTYVVAGESTSGESAFSIRLSQSDGQAKVLWRYTNEKSRQLAGAGAGLPFGGAANVPGFRGAAALPDGSVFLCGYGIGAPGRDRPSLLVHVEGSGHVASEEVLQPPSDADPLKGARAIFSTQPDVVLSGLDGCVAWGDGIGLVGRASFYSRSASNPAVREGRYYHWILFVDTTGKIVWQKLLPLAFLPSPIAELTSVLITPEKNLLFTRHWGGESEVLSISQSGQLVAQRQLNGVYVAVHLEGSATSIQLFGGEPLGTKNLLTVDEDLNDLSREDGLNLPRFVAKSAYGGKLGSLLLVGQAIREPQSLSAVCYVTASRRVTTETLAHAPLSDDGSGGVSAPSSRPNRIVVARRVFERASLTDVKRLGITLDSLEPTEN
jgi:hypothetical protein